MANRYRYGEDDWDAEGEIDDIADDAAPTGRILSQVSAWTDRLMSDGEPSPAYIVRNAQDKGEPCPRLVFIRSVKPPAIGELSLEWGVPASRLMSWRKEQQWDRQRSQYWANESKRMWELSGKELAEIRGRALMQTESGFLTIQEMIIEQVRRGGRDKVSPTTGQPEFVAYDPSDLGKLAKAYEIASKGRLAALGLNLVVASDANQEGEDEGSAPVVNMIFNMPASPEERLQLPSASPPSSSLSMEAIEGEVISSPVERSK